MHGLGIFTRSPDFAATDSEVFHRHAEMLGGLPSASHASARQEYRALVEALRLPHRDKAPAPGVVPMVGHKEPDSEPA